MTRSTLVSIALALLAGVCRADEVPTMTDLRTLEAQSDWRDLLQGTSRALQLKDATGYDRPELYRMKSEAHVQQKQFSVAADTLAAGSREKEIDAATADRFAALAILYRTSDARGYKPPATKQNPNPQAFDVLTPAARADALKALCDVRLAALSKDVASLGDRSQMADFSSAASEAMEVTPLERTVVGTASQCDAAIVEVQARFADRANRWMADTRVLVEKIAKEANEVVNDRRRGLKGSDQMTLGAAMTDCQKWVGGHRKFVESLDGRATATVQALRQDFQILERRANEVLTAKYGKVSSRDEDKKR